MIRDRDPPTARRCAHRGDMPDIPRQDARPARLENLDLLLARSVGDGDQAHAVLQPLSKPIAAPCVVAMLANRAFPQREAEQLAARNDGDAVALRMRVEAFQVVGGRHEPARGLRSVRRQPHVETFAAIAGRIEQPQLRAALIDDALPVGLRVACVEVVVIGVTRDVRTVRPARIEVADAFRIGEEEHALADPHRAGHVAFEPGQAPELAGPLRVDPQVSRRAAAVTLPARGVRRIASDDARLARPERKMIDLPQRQRGRHSPCRIERERAIVAEERLPVGRDEDDVPVARPATNDHVGSEPGEPPRGPALGGHHVDLRMLLVATDECDPASVRRQARRRRLGQSRGQAAGRTSGGGNTPEVVIADEDDRVVVERRIAQVAGMVVHGVSIGTRTGILASPRVDADF